MERQKLEADDTVVTLEAADSGNGGSGPTSEREPEGPNGAPAGRRRAVTALEGEGLLFVNGDACLAGAIRLCGETFQCTARPAESSSGSSYWVIVGQGDRGDAVSGRLFRERGSSTPSGRFRPRITGHVTTVAGRSTRRVAGWPRTSNAAAFYSLKLTIPKQDDTTMLLPFDPPLSRVHDLPAGPA
jgi:hypothetical protein